MPANRSQHALLSSTGNPEQTIQRSDKYADRHPIAFSNDSSTQDQVMNDCAIWPGHGREEGGRMGYQVLLRMKWFISRRHRERASSVSLLCILSVSSDSADSSNVRATASKLYRRDCSGQLLVNWKDHGEIEFIGDGTIANRHEIRVSRFVDVFQYVKSLHFSWFHWTDPSKYYFIPSNLVQLIPSKPHRKPLTSQLWILEDPQSNLMYHGLYARNIGGNVCDSPRTGNLALAQLLAGCSIMELSPQNRSLPHLHRWIEQCTAAQKVDCHVLDESRHRLEKWAFTQRFFEIPIPQPGVAASLRRLDSILSGSCDMVWDKPAGALDGKGYPGYIHDATFVRRNPPPFTFHPPGDERSVCATTGGEGDEGFYGYQGLQKIRIAATHQNKRVLCMIYTHSNAHDRLKSIAETWGSRCDGFIGASNATDPTIGAVNLLHEGPETYDNMWMKVVSMWRYAYDYYLNDYDYFHIGGDDHYVIVENLRYAVSVGSWKGPWDEATPLYLGGSLVVRDKRRYCNGGSGYTLNRVALKLFVEELLHKPVCMPHWQASYEDRMVASCFRSVGIQCMDTNDEKNETRYHTWHADQHAAWKVGKPGQNWKKLVSIHGIAWKEGLGQISESSVSFHLKDSNSKSMDKGMRRYHALLYNLCPAAPKLQ